ncbi:adenine phosphoribosyltransferase [Rickettsiales bacterium LUAb2]
MDIIKFIDKIPNFPKPGILFYDLSPMLASASAWEYTINEISKLVADMEPDIVAGIESRGFLISSAIATKLKLGSVLIRKKGKTPGKVISHTYKLEYGEDTLEIKADIIKPKQKVVILDDVLATGGTINASIKLLEQAGAVVRGAVCIMELNSLNGRNNLNIPVSTFIKF